MEAVTPLLLNLMAVQAPPARKPLCLLAPALVVGATLLVDAAQAGLLHYTGATKQLSLATGWRSHPHFTSRAFTLAMPTERPSALKGRSTIEWLTLLHNKLGHPKALNRLGVELGAWKLEKTKLWGFIPHQSRQPTDPHSSASGADHLASVLRGDALPTVPEQLLIKLLLGAGLQHSLVGWMKKPERRAAKQTLAKMAKQPSLYDRLEIAAATSQLAEETQNALFMLLASS